MPQLRSEFLMPLNAQLEAPLVLLDTPLGTRRILYAKSGSFRGPGLEGEVLAGGGDWVLDRRDGVAELDIRLIRRTADGELIYVSGGGIFDMAPQIRERIRSGGRSTLPNTTSVLHLCSQPARKNIAGSIGWWQSESAGAPRPA